MSMYCLCQFVNERLTDWPVRDSQATRITGQYMIYQYIGQAYKKLYLSLVSYTLTLPLHFWVKKNNFR